MWRVQRILVVGLVAACLLVLAEATHWGAPRVVGQTQENPAANADTGYTLTWWTVDTGGDLSVGSGEYTLSSTAGQPDAAVVSAGEYTLSGGFWGGGGQVARFYILHLPLIARTFSSGGTDSLAPGHYIYLPVITRPSP